MSEDVKDILGLGSSKEHVKLEDIMSPKKSKIKQKEKKLKKPEGVSREVYALTESIAPLPANIIESSTISITPSITLPNPIVFKEKRKLQLIDKAVPWVLTPFRNSARKDSSAFFHWAKENEKVDDYKFARFNKKITVFDYTEEQYNKYFTDQNWSKDETHELWNLIKQYDLRFIVIHDRFKGISGNNTGPTQKSIEDMKNRYYSISKKLLELNAYHDEDISKHPLIKFPYRYEQEVERKNQIDILYNRTPEQIEEEKRLIIEYKRIESNLKKVQKEKKKVVKLTQSSLGVASSPNINNSDKKKKKKKDADFNSNQDDEYNPNSISSPTHSSTQDSSGSKIIKKEKASGPFVRSHTILTQLPVSNKTSKRVDDLLVELGVGLRPMPTAAICKIFNEIRQDIVTFVDLERSVDQKEYQVQLLKQQKSVSNVGFGFGGNTKYEKKSKLNSSADSFADDFDFAFETPKQKKRMLLGDKEKKKKKKKMDMEN